MIYYRWTKNFIHRVIIRGEKIRGGGTDFNDLIQGKKRGECTESNLWCDLQSINISNQINQYIESINQSFHQSMCWKPSKNYSLMLSIFSVTNNKHFFVFKK